MTSGKRAMRGLVCCLILVTILASGAAPAKEKRIKVFVALADNASQGIVPVPAKIGNGDDPENNLYWGCTEGFRGVFGASAKWRLTKKTVKPADNVLERNEYRHATREAILTADAFRGSAIRSCIQNFEAAVAGGEYDLAAYIGHNGLMDEAIPPPEARADRKAADSIVLCCLSARYFESRMRGLGSRPVLLTTQLMYPGSFILHDSLETWLAKGSMEECRMAAARAYAKNQGIRLKSAAGVFMKLNGASQ